MRKAKTSKTVGKILLANTNLSFHVKSIQLFVQSTTPSTTCTQSTNNVLLTKSVVYKYVDIVPQIRLVERMCFKKKQTKSSI